MNQTKHKVLIQYVLNSKDVSTLSWACSCFSGLRTVGSCVHVATVIFYLSYAKYQKELSKCPGFSLNRIVYKK